MYAPPQRAPYDAVTSHHCFFVKRDGSVALSAYDLPTFKSLVQYFHAAAGFPVKSTWISAIKSGNYATWPSLTHNNAAKYCPSEDETVIGHI